MSISLDTAQAMVERARVQAAALDVPMNIAVVNGGGQLLVFARMDGAILGSIDIAPAKAKTSILFNGPSENLRDFCRPGGPAPATEYTNGSLIPYAGGVALHEEAGVLTGAIGVCGGMPDQDGEVARAGIAAHD
ncbi:GlcG/HbpS family heme-binding protein [Streptomyces mirabilis]|uniref:GlcG/HbpS family heme-binding protein n=1 Tax=Streptomyces mirabilis TaxID=68239 RepID=UPI003325E6B2